MNAILCKLAGDNLGIAVGVLLADILALALICYRLWASSHSIRADLKRAQQDIIRLQGVCAARAGWNRADQRLIQAMEDNRADWSAAQDVRDKSQLSKVLHFPQNPKSLDPQETYTRVRDGGNGGV